MSYSSVLVTGATGFVGLPLCRRLQAQGVRVTGIARHSATTPVPVHAVDLLRERDWDRWVSGQDAVVHLAAKVHDMATRRSDEYYALNRDVTLELARRSAAAGVKKFIFLSSIKVNGEFTPEGTAFTEQDAPQPGDDYAQSKAQAEQGLFEIARQTGLKVVILRPPLVYGPGVKANFARLLSAVAQGRVLPLGGKHNRRSMVYVGNLVDAIVRCLDDARADNQCYLVADREALTMEEFIRLLARQFGTVPRLLPVPSSLLRGMGSVIGRRAQIDRLLQSLVVNSAKIQTQLGWIAPYSLQQGLAETVDSYRKH